MKLRSILKFFTSRYAREHALYKFRCIFAPRQRWLTSRIPKTWCDKPELLRDVNFAILVDFVESEQGLGQLDLSWDDDIAAGYVTAEYVASIKSVYSELKDVYTYIKEERPKLEEQYYASFPDYPCSGTYEEAYGKTDRLESLLDSKDSWALHTIIKHRGVLWT